MEKIENFKAGEGGQNAYDKDRVRLTNEINSLNEIDAKSLEERSALSLERNEVLDAAQEGYRKAQTEATLVNEQYHTKPSEDPDIERARQEKIKRLQDDLRSQMK